MIGLGFEHDPSVSERLLYIFYEQKVLGNIINIGDYNCPVALNITL